MIKRKGQLYWDDKITTLSNDDFSLMLDEKTNTIRYNSALSFFSSLREKIEPSLLKDFQWLKMEYTVPYFADVVFRFKNKVFAVIFVKKEKDGLLNRTCTIEMSLETCRKNNLIPSLMVFNDNGDILNLTNNKYALLNGYKYYEEGLIEEVDPEKIATDDFASLSEWELYNTSVMAIVENLYNKEKITQILYQTFMGVDPAICWIDNDNVFNWMVIRTVKERDLKPEEPKELLEKISTNQGKGHYGLCEISNPYAPNVFPRGQKFDLKFEIIDL